MKQFIQFQNFLSSVKRGEKSVIFSQDYVVLSKNAYEALIDFHHPEFKSVMYDELSMNDWIKKRFIEEDKK